MTSSSFYVIGWKFDLSYIKSLSKKYYDEDEVVEILGKKLEKDSKYHIVFPNKHNDCQEPFEGGYECFLSVHTDNKPLSFEDINDLISQTHELPNIFEDFVIDKTHKFFTSWYDLGISSNISISFENDEESIISEEDETGSEED